MKTDTLFYKIFQTFPDLVFELLGRPVVRGYAFTSVEVKEKAFRFDGIFAPPADVPDAPIYFLEVQFQPDPDFYWQFISEICLYLNQRKPRQDWVAVAIFPSRSVDVKNLTSFQQDMVNLGRLVRIHLDELPAISSPEFGMLRLITCAPEEAIEVVNQIRLMSRAKDILEFVETILVYKFPRLTREEIERMFTLDDLRQTRVYQEGRLEGKQEGRIEGRKEGRIEGRREGEAQLLLRLVTRKFGNLSPERSEQIKALPIDRLEELAEALLDFTAIHELYQWLDREEP